MNILKLFGKGKPKKQSMTLDAVQEALNKVGREQFRRLMDKGLKVPVVLV